jgi:hypothetical protein
MRPAVALAATLAVATAACPGGRHDHVQGEHAGEERLDGDRGFTDVDGGFYPCEETPGPYRSGLELSFEDVAPRATALIVLVDGPCLAAPVQARASPTEPLRIPLPSGSAYRVRGISVISEDGFLHVLDGGTATGFSLPPGRFRKGLLHVHRYEVKPNPLNPTTVKGGHPMQLRFGVVNEGSLITAGMSLLVAQGTTPASPLAATGIQAIPLRAEPGPDGYAIQSAFAAPGQPRQLRYRLFIPVLSGLDRAAYVTFPELALAEPELPIEVVASPVGVTLDVQGLPAEAHGLIAAVDGPGLPTPVQASGPKGPLRIGLPRGGPYRLRAVAVKPAEPPFVALRSLLLGNLRLDAADVTVSPASNSIAIVPDAANPTTAEKGGQVVLRFRASDPDQVLVESQAALLVSSQALDQNASPRALRITSSGARSGASVSWSATLTAPAESGPMNYQMAVRALGLAAVPIEVYAPDLSAGAAPLTLDVR